MPEVPYRNNVARRPSIPRSGARYVDSYHERMPDDWDETELGWYLVRRVELFSTPKSGRLRRKDLRECAEDPAAVVTPRGQQSRNPRPGLRRLVVPGGRTIGVRGRSLPPCPSATRRRRDPAG
jgi:hypothetical protein